MNKQGASEGRPGRGRSARVCGLQLKNELQHFGLTVDE